MTLELSARCWRVVEAGTDVELRLRRVEPARTNGAPVLLLHGGNTASEIFCVPDGGLAGYLHEAGFDVWLLDWRSSPFVTAKLPQEVTPASVANERRAFTLDVVASRDLPEALERVQSENDRPIAVVAHCLSGAVVSMAIARGLLEQRGFTVSKVSLLTLGLFCEAPALGWLKAQNFFLERVLHEEPLCRGLNPFELDTWPRTMREASAAWPRAWNPQASEFLQRLTFMIGQPWDEERLHPELQGASLEPYFGLLHLGFYMHAGQIVRRGYVAPFDAPDVIDRARLDEIPGATAQRDGLVDLEVEHFAKRRITLFTAPRNQVWHRHSMDLMYSWLRNEGCTPDRCRKYVFPGFNLQELLWAHDAPRLVYPRIADSVRD